MSRSDAGWDATLRPPNAVVHDLSGVIRAVAAMDLVHVNGTRSEPPGIAAE